MLQCAVDEQGGLPDDEFRKLYKAMLAYYSENNAVHTRPYPHAREVLADVPPGEQDPVRVHSCQAPTSSGRI